MTDSPTDAVLIRCPACEKFAVQGQAHECPNGRDRENFQDPLREGQKKKRGK